MTSITRNYWIMMIFAYLSIVAITITDAMFHGEFPLGKCYVIPVILVGLCRVCSRTILFATTAISTFAIFLIPFLFGDHLATEPFIFVGRVLAAVILWVIFALLTTARAARQIGNESLQIATESRERMAMMKATFNAVSEGVIAIDRNFTITEFNDAARNILGHGNVNQPFSELLSNLKVYVEDTSHEMNLNETPLAQALTGRITSKLELITKSPQSDRTTILRVNASPIRDSETNEIIGAVSTFVDVTRESELSQQLQHSQKMESVGRLAGGIAHDFNNKLCVLKLAVSQAIKKRENNQSYARELELMDSITDKCADLTRQILAFGRRQVMRPRVLEANGLVAAGMPIWKRMLEENVSLKIHLEATRDRIKIDPIFLEQIILNLVANARDAMPDGGKIIIESSNKNFQTSDKLPPGEYFCLTVSDTGMGIPRELLPKIFDPYFTTKTAGSGLGLATVFGIVKQSDGHIWVYSEEGKGTTFRAYFPTSASPLDEIVPKKSVGAIPANIRILVVEDDPGILSLITTLLTQGGMDVLSAADGDIALECLKKEAKIDLLLTDAILPGGLNGGQLAVKIKASRPEIKVLFMSGYTENVIVHHGVLDAGVEMISKPFDPDELMRKLIEIINKPVLA